MIIYCTPSERELLNALPENIRNDCEIRDETLTYDDTPASMQERLLLIQPKTPALIEFWENVRAARSEEDVRRIVAGISGIALSEKEMLDLCFGLGPVFLGDIVEQHLRSATTHDEVADAGAWSEMRHAVVETLQSVPPLI